MRTSSFLVATLLLITALVLLLNAGFSDASKSRSRSWSRTSGKSGSSSLRVGSFNIQVFGMKKVSDASVVSVLLKTLSRYDIVLVQEIRDASGDAINILLKQLNAVTGKKYEMALSDRLGRTNSKEAYAYIYDSAKVDVVMSYQYPTTFDEFERPPFSVLIQNKQKSQRWFLTGVHISPGKAPKEIDTLVNVYEYYRSQSALTKVVEDNWIVMGDFNADCGYMRKNDWINNRLASNGDKFKFLIQTGTRTTVANNPCAYDRFVTTHKLKNWNPDVTVFRFDQAYALTPEQTKKVSDHFPIEMSINW